MNFLELYKLCKPYVEYIEQNKETIENLIRIDEAESIKELILLSDEIHVSFEKGIRVFDEAFKLQTNIESAIREEVAEEIIDINERQKKTSETALDYLLDEDDESNYECEYALADDFKEKIEVFDTHEMSPNDIIRLLNNWLGR